MTAVTNMGNGAVGCADVFCAFYYLIGPMRFWVMVACVIYSTIYSTNIYITGMRRAHELHALGLPRSVQASANEEFSYRLSRREPFMLIYVAAFVIFLLSSASVFIELSSMTNRVSIK